MYVYIYIRGPKYLLISGIWSYSFIRNMAPHLMLAIAAVCCFCPLFLLLSGVRAFRLLLQKAHAVCGDLLSSLPAPMSARTKKPRALENTAQSVSGRQFGPLTVSLRLIIAPNRSSLYIYIYVNIDIYVYIYIVYVALGPNVDIICRLGAPGFETPRYG